MICTCEKCKINFFPGEPPIVCPECGGEVVARQGWTELHYLVNLLARGEIRESLAPYINTQPEKAPALMDVVERIDALLDSIPRETSDRYFMELNHLKGFLFDYYNGRYYEVLHRRGIPKIETIGTKMLMGLMSLEQKLAHNYLGAGEIIMPWAYEKKETPDPAPEADEVKPVAEKPLTPERRKAALQYLASKGYDPSTKEGLLMAKMWVGIPGDEEMDGFTRTELNAALKAVESGMSYEDPRGAKKYREWLPGAEAAFRHFMPPISAPYPKVYFSNAGTFRATRENIVKDVGCTLQGWPDDSSLEYIHGDKGGAILIRLDQLPKDMTFDVFLHLFWHELGHFYAINADPYNLERFDDPDNPPDEENVAAKQRGYWFWQEFIAEAICNYVNQKVSADREDYHPENIDWVVDAWSPYLYRLQGLLDEMFFRPDIDEYCLAHYFATLLMDDVTVRMVRASQEGKLKQAGKDTPAPAGSIDVTCIDELDAEFQPILLEMKDWLEKQLAKEQFWIIDEAGIEYLGGLILRMAEVYGDLRE